MKKVVLVLAAIAIASARVGGCKTQLFQAIAHLFLGGLVVDWRYGYKLAGQLALALSVVETVCFLISKLFP